MTRMLSAEEAEIQPTDTILADVTAIRFMKRPGGNLREAWRKEKKRMDKFAEEQNRRRRRRLLTYSREVFITSMMSLIGDGKEESPWMMN